MESKHKLAVWLCAILALFVVGMSCNKSVVDTQREKTKQLQIMNGMLLYQLDRQDSIRRPPKTFYY